MSTTQYTSKQKPVLDITITEQHTALVKDPKIKLEQRNQIYVACSVKITKKIGGI